MTEAEQADTIRLPEARKNGAAALGKSVVDSVETKADKQMGLVEAGDVDRYRDDWRTVQSGFVDDPAGAVRDADALVGRLFDSLTKRINEQRAALSAHRPGAEGEHTEQLRQALRDYRTMFEQLLPTSHS